MVRNVVAKVWKYGAVEVIYFILACVSYDAINMFSNTHTCQVHLNNRYLN